MLTTNNIKIELHVNGNTRLERVIAHDIYVFDEFSGVVKNIQEQLRPKIVVKRSLDNFIQIGQHKELLPDLAYDNPYFTVLCVQRVVDVWRDKRLVGWQQDCEDVERLINKRNHKAIELWAVNNIVDVFIEDGPDEIIAKYGKTKGFPKLLKVIYPPKPIYQYPWQDGFVLHTNVDLEYNEE